MSFVCVAEGANKMAQGKRSKSIDVASATGCHSVAKLWQGPLGVKNCSAEKKKLRPVFICHGTPKAAPMA